jgi:hypothetical protein
MTQIIQFIEQKRDFDQLVTYVLNHQKEIDVLINEIQTNPKAIKFKCEKILRFISEKSPHLIYPFLNFYSELMHSENSFLKWGAIITIANLAKVDNHNKIELTPESCTVKCTKIKFWPLAFLF